jgi:ribosomal protein L10
MAEKIREKPIPEYKKRLVTQLEKLIKEKKTVLIASIKGLPTAMLQEISKDLRGKAEVKVPKKNLILRAMEATKDPQVKELEKQIHEDVAILFSDQEAFDLAADLLQNKTPALAKAGQIAPFDIKVEPGPTELVPGPAISELGSVGIQVQVKDGKLEIKQTSIIVKEGKEISAEAASVMQKLGIKPFSVGLIPLYAFDTQEKKLYTEIKIDSEETIANLKSTFGRALPFAVEIGYATNETIKFLLSKANAHGKALEKFAEVSEAKTESNEGGEVKEETENSKEDNKIEQKTETSKSEEKPAEEKTKKEEQTQAPEDKLSGEGK